MEAQRSSLRSDVRRGPAHARSSRPGELSHGDLDRRTWGELRERRTFTVRWQSAARPERGRRRARICPIRRARTPWRRPSRGGSTTPVTHSVSPPMSTLPGEPGPRSNSSACACRPNGANSNARARQTRSIGPGARRTHAVPRTYPRAGAGGPVAIGKSLRHRCEPKSPAAMRAGRHDAGRRRAHDQRRVYPVGNAD